MSKKVLNCPILDEIKTVPVGGLILDGFIQFQISCYRTITSNKIRWCFNSCFFCAFLNKIPAQNDAFVTAMFVAEGSDFIPRFNYMH